MNNVIAVIVALLFTFTAQAKNEKVEILTGNWPPYLSEDLPHNGALAQITKEAFAYMNIDVKYTFLPWARVFIRGSRDEGDLILAYSKSKKRELHFSYGPSLYKGSYHFFYNINEPIHWNKLSDLDDKLIGTPRGYSGMGRKFLRAEESGKLNVLRLNHDFQVFNLLAKGRIQATPSDKNVGNYYKNFLLPKEDGDLIAMHPKAVKHTVYHIVGPKRKAGTQRLLELFRKGLKILKASGRYQKILNEHQIR